MHQWTGSEVLLLAVLHGISFDISLIGRLFLQPGLRPPERFIAFAGLDFLCCSTAFAVTPCKEDFIAFRALDLVP